MKHLGKNLGRTLAVALLVGAGSVISAVSALPDYLQAAETASAADKRQECIQEVAGSNPVTVRQHEVVLKDHQGRELYTGKYLELAAKNGAGHDVRRALAQWNDAERMRWAGDEKMLSDAVHFTEENGLPMYAPYYMGHAIADWGRVDAEVLSFCTRTESYTGGAHPNHAYQSWTLDLRTGEPIALRDIVASRRDFLTAVAAARSTRGARMRRSGARSTRSSSPSTRTSTGISPRSGPCCPRAASASTSAPTSSHRTLLATSS